MDMVAMVDWSVAVRMPMRMRWAMRVLMTSIGPLFWGMAVRMRWAMRVLVSSIAPLLCDMAAQRAAARSLRLQVGRGGRLQPRLVDLDIHAVTRVSRIPLPQVRLRRSALLQPCGFWSLG